jgi:hypothetical protein
MSIRRCLQERNSFYAVQQLNASGWQHAGSWLANDCMWSHQLIFENKYLMMGAQCGSKYDICKRDGKLMTVQSYGLDDQRMEYCTSNG